MKQIFTLRNIILVAIGLSGMAALIYEVAWARMLSLIFGSTVYGVATMLSAFMAGLALGSFFMAKRVDRISDLAKTFGFLQIGIGTYGFLFLFGLSFLQYPYFLFYQWFGQWFPLFLFSQFLLYFLVLLIPTALMGATFPVASKIFTTRIDKVGKDIGYVYGANSLGSVLGPILAGFILIPILGVTKTAVIAGAINILLGIFILRCSRFRRGAAVALFLLIFVFLSWNFFPPAIMLNLFQVGFVESVAEFKEVNREIQPIFYREGPYSTVVVAKTDEGVLGLKSDGRGEASTLLEDMRNHILLGYIPMLLHPNPRKVLNIGLGSGVTAGAMADFESVKSLEAIEVEPAIVEAARTVFAPFNSRVMEDPRLIVHRTDGRNHFLLTRERYDVIVSEVSHPISAGTGHLFTKELFELIKSRLNDDGIFLQWIPGHRISIEEHRIVSATLGRVFPYVTLWIDDIAALENPEQNVETYLIASLKPIEFDPNLMVAKIRENKAVVKKLGQIGLAPEDIPRTAVLDNEDFRNFISKEKRLNTDDRPIFEFAVPRSLLKSQFVTLNEIKNQ